MESGGIESSAAAAQAASATSSSVAAVHDNSVRLLVSGIGVGGCGDSFDAVHLQKMKLMAENNVDKALAVAATVPPPPSAILPPSSVSSLASPLQTLCNINNNNNITISGAAAAVTDNEILQIVELSDLLATSGSGTTDNHDYERLKKFAEFAPAKATSKVGQVAVADDQLIDFSSAEKCDITPENLKKSDHEVNHNNCSKDESLLIDLEDGGNSAMVMQFCDTTTRGGGEDGATKEAVQLTLLDLDEPPPPPPPPPEPEKPKAFTISFGDEQRSEEQKQKYEKMFERFQNKRHKRGQSLSRVDVELAKSGGSSQDSQVPSSPAPSTSSSSGKPGQKLAKTPSSAKLPRKTFSEPSSTKATEDQQQQHLDDDAKVKLRDKRNAAMREPSKRHSWSPRTTTTTMTANPAPPPPPVVVMDVIVPPPASVKKVELENVNQRSSRVREVGKVTVDAKEKKKQEEVDDVLSEQQEQRRPLQMALGNGKFTARSSVLAKVLDTKMATRNVIENAASQVQHQQPQQLRKLPEAPPPVVKNAMQRGFVCEVQPLIDDSREEVDEELSDAGTYTLDGDNYTEEQKEMMDIDNLRKERQLELNKWDEDDEEELMMMRMMNKNNSNNGDEVTFLKCKRPPLQRPTSFEPSLEIIDLELIPSSPKELKALESDLNSYYDTPMTQSRRSNGRNVLEISCTYEEPANMKSTTTGKPVPVAKQKVSYLEKIKTKVKNLGGKSSANRSSQSSIEPEKELPSPDVGTFTSVTTSGILSFKPTLEDKPVKLGRRNSLTKTQIQNTEYVQGVSRVLPAAEDVDDKIMDSITDSDKLNLLSSSENDETTTTSSLKSAVTKNDWIHEWAKTARRNTSEMSRSFTVDSNVNRLRDDPMSRSECFNQEEGPGGNENNVDRNNAQKQQQNLGKTSNFVRGRAGEDVNSPLAQLRYSVRRRYSGDKGLMLNSSSDALATVNTTAVTSRRPPMSPTKIPSPVHTISRARSMSHNRSQDCSTTDVSVAGGGGQLMSPTNNNDTDVYLQNTAAAILTLQSMHLNNSLHNSPSPSHPTSPRGRGNVGGRTVTSPLHSLSPQRDAEAGYNIIEECQNKMNRIQQLHKRNLSLDGSERDRNRSRYGKNNALGRVQRTDQQQQHTRHHSYEGAQGIRQSIMARGGIDQTMGNYDDEEEEEQQQQRQQQHVARQHQQAMKGHGAPQSSPIRRSSSFSTKPGANGNVHGGSGGGHQRVMSGGGVGQGNARQGNSIKKSASSTSFKKYHYEDEGDIYINDDDDLDPGRMSNDSEYSYDMDGQQGRQGGADPITNTRCNKAFMMRREQNKNKPAVNPTVVNQTTVGVGGKSQGVVACPNTPEMTRRGQLMMRQPLRDRQSMPRDSSMNRMKQDLSMNLSSTKKVLKEAPATTTTVVGAKVQPKYLDISKYKPTTTGNFLKKDESKSYLVKSSSVAVTAGGGGLDGIKRSPSSASVTLSRTDPTRMSNRSVKSAGMRPSQKKDQIAPSKAAKEQELAMWRRRASYDPMKAAMEGKRRQEEAKRMLAQQQQQQQSSKLPESSLVLRSQSFHSGATMLRQMDPMERMIDDESNPDTRWTTESSDEDF